MLRYSHFITTLGWICRPIGAPPENFAFDRYGVRVPAVIVSPYLAAPGSVARPPEHAVYPFDHTSIIATVRRLFNLGGPLTGRDAAAPDLLHLIDLDGPMLDAPLSIEPPATQPAPGAGAAMAALPPNGMQEALCKMAGKMLPVASDVSIHLAHFLGRI